MSNTVNLTAAQAAMVGQDVKATATPTFAGIITNGTTDISLLHAAQTAGSGTAGASSRLVGGAGAAAATAVAASIGGALAVTGGVGGASDGVDLAANGGAAAITGGAGGAAHTAVVGGIGATSTVAGGAGGAGSAGAAGGAGGNALINAGPGGVTGGGGAGADGNVQIGSENTALIQVGNAVDNPGTTFLGTGQITMPQLLVNGASDQALTPAAQAAGSAIVGGNVTATAGAGAAAAGAVAGAVGGALAAAGGAGGASDGANAAANGGTAALTGGAGGAAHTAIVGGIGATATVAGGAGGAGSAGAAGGAGGNAIFNAGAGGVTGGGGAGANGLVQIASANTLRVELGNVTTNPIVQVLGTGNINLLGGGAILHPDFVRVTIVATGGIGGATAGTISVQVSDLAGTAINRAVKLRLDSSLIQFGGGLASTGTAFFGAATTGAINHGTGTLYAIVTTDATGLYAGALDDAADETAWFSATSAPGGFANAAEGCVVVECVPNDATWAA